MQFHIGLMFCYKNVIKFCCVPKLSVQIWSMIGIVEEPSAITMTFVAGVRVCILVQKEKRLLLWAIAQFKGSTNSLTSNS